MLSVKNKILDGCYNTATTELSDKKYSKSGLWQITNLLWDGCGRYVFMETLLKLRDEIND